MDFSEKVLLRSVPVVFFEMVPPVAGKAGGIEAAGEEDFSGLTGRACTITGLGKGSDARDYSCLVTSGLVICDGELAKELRQLPAES